MRHGVKQALAVLVALTGLVHRSKAQEQVAPEWPYKVEVFGTIAHGGFYNGRHVWGRGLDYGGGLGFRPFSGKLHRLGFEVQAARLKTSEATTVYPSLTMDSRLFMANAVCHFRDGTKAQPYVYGGLGRVDVDYYRRCVACVFDRDPVTGELVPRVTEENVSGSKLGVTLGAGLKIALHNHLSIRPELLFVNTTPGSGWNWGWVRLQIGLGAHF